MMLLRHLFSALLWLRLCQSQDPPPLHNGDLQVIHSPINPNITISYKSPPPGTCTTVFPAQKQYVGHVILPPMALAPVQQNYSINTFFWFIEARDHPEAAPLTIWLNGGPGSSSMVGLFQESGPCEVVELARDTLGTKAREWGWDRSSNMLYIDQPNQVGFSYDTPTEGSLNLLTGDVSTPPAERPEIQPANTFLTGKFSSNTPNATTNTTELSAHAIWHMLQGFLAEFPQYNPGTRPGSNATSAAGINLFTESYGGKYGPAFAYYWEQQNMRRTNGSIQRNSTVDVKLRSLGIMNGCVDDLIQGPFYPLMASNNSYGIQALTQGQALAVTESFLGPDGCKEAIQECRNAASSSDPENEGDVSSVNDICSKAQDNCNDNVLAPYTSSGRDVYDIAHGALDPFPSSTYQEYLNSGDFHEAISAQINYTESSAVVQGAFIHAGDWESGDQVSQLASLLSSGVRVALVYGDRDYICNWMGGDAVAYAIAGSLPSTYSPFLSTAGFADIIVNDSYVGGQVRQYGNLSFSRIYDAGHLVPAYQPETAFTVFTRIFQGVDISTGEPVDLHSFATKGDANSTYTNSAPPAPAATCWLRNVPLTCTDDQKTMLQQGKGVIINGILYDQESDWKAPDAAATSQAGVPGQPSPTSSATGPSGAGPSASATTVATGVYVATGPPPTATKKGAASTSRPANPLVLALAVLLISLPSQLT